MGPTHATAQLIITRIVIFTVLCLFIILVTILNSDLVQAQSSPEIVKVMGQAEILSAGHWREAKTGDLIEPGESVMLVGQGEVSLSVDQGQTTVNLKNEGLLQYDGEVKPNSRPWQLGQLVPSISVKDETTGDKTGQFTLSQGEVDVQVKPGQPLRVVTPLIAAAVRGTHFVITVAIDGSSSLGTIDGKVLTMGRNGVSQLVEEGGEVQLTSNQFTDFLRQKGINVPPGGWRDLDPKILDKVDPDAFGLDKGANFVKEELPGYLTVNHFISYFALILSAIFVYLFLLDLAIYKQICIILAIISIAVLYYFTCNDLICNFDKFIYLYFISPALYFINGVITRKKYVLIPLAILFLSVIFAYNFEISIILCSLIIIINVFYIIKFINKYQKNQELMSYIKHFLLLGVIAVCGYIVSLFLSKQFYYDAYKLITSLV